MNKTLVKWKIFKFRGRVSASEYTPLNWVTTLHCTGHHLVRPEVACQPCTWSVWGTCGCHLKLDIFLATYGIIILHRNWVVLQLNWCFRKLACRARDRLMSNHNGQECYRRDTLGQVSWIKLCEKKKLAKISGILAVPFDSAFSCGRIITRDENGLAACVNPWSQIRGGGFGVNYRNT